MTLMSEEVTRRRLRAPRQHGAALIEPPLADVGSLITQNKSVIERHDAGVQGRSLSGLSRMARQDLIRDAEDYTKSYRDVADAPADSPILLSGHQPQLFHAGVWSKNFALSQLGQQFQARAVNLLIDNDDARDSSIRVPTGSLDEPRVTSVAFDGATSETAFEERAVIDDECFYSFASRVKQRIAPLVDDPLVTELWEPIVEIRHRTANLGQCLAQSRHILEGNLGLQTLELPLSRVCQSPAFRWFALHLLAQLPRFLDAYNSALGDYRRINGLRSRTHPVPDLAVDSGWLEAPLWIWSIRDPVRRRLFVRFLDDRLELTDRANLRKTLGLTAEGTADRAVEQLAALEREGVKLRPRALITTMFSRLFLSDLFLHGIGGAKYDEVTDQIIRKFFGIQPPRFLTLTASMMLPIEVPNVDPQDLANLDHQLRQLNYHPEKYLVPAPSGHVSNLIADKQHWIETQLPRGQRLERHREITRINHDLQPYLTETRRQLQANRQTIKAGLQRESRLASREFSFCLFPKQTLFPRLLELFPRGT